MKGAGRMARRTDGEGIDEGRGTGDQRHKWSEKNIRVWTG